MKTEKLDGRLAEKNSGRGAGGMTRPGKKRKMTKRREKKERRSTERGRVEKVDA